MKNMTRMSETVAYFRDFSESTKQVLETRMNEQQ